MIWNWLSGCLSTIHPVFVPGCSTSWRLLNGGEMFITGFSRIFHHAYILIKAFLWHVLASYIYYCVSISLKGFLCFALWRRVKVANTDSVVRGFGLDRTIFIPICFTFLLFSHFLPRCAEGFVELTQFCFMLNSIRRENLTRGCHSLWVLSKILLACSTLLCACHCILFIHIIAL